MKNNFFVALGVAGILIGMAISAANAQETTAARSVFDRPPGSLQDSLPATDFDKGSYDDYRSVSVPDYYDVTTPCFVGRDAIKKLGKRSWQVGSLTPTYDRKMVRADLFRTSKHKSATASSMSFETTCVILPPKFWTARTVRASGKYLAAMR
ncbi:MAG: hypothetical protein JWM46_769 [Candidatus Kaiserbacteria bacterium]|nr:hypothetical protein [Candidatus Kaiserbacteria bacterium]